MNRRTVIALMLGALVGCGRGFRDDAEELSYLETLENPTPAQWQRRNELRNRELMRQVDALLEADRASGKWPVKSAPAPK